MRRLLSILLFGATLLPLIAPIFANAAMAESMLPACCRRAGKHQCGMLPADRAMSMGGQANNDSKSPKFDSPLEKCPYRQHSLAPVHFHVFTATGSATQATTLLQKPSAAAQAECLRRISFDRSRQKRGPPSFLS